MQLNGGHQADTVRITQRTIGALSPPEKGNRIIYDDDLTGFGVRITAAGSIGFVLRYVVDRRERRLTIGKYPDLSPSAAREEAILLRGLVSKGVDPLEERLDRRGGAALRRGVSAGVHSRAPLIGDFHVRTRPWLLEDR